MTPPITIRELDGRDPASVDTLLPIFQAVTASDLVGHPEPTTGMLSAQLIPRANHVQAVLAAFDEAGTAVAFAKIGHDTLSDRTLAYGVMWSEPARRRAGFGSALLARVTDWARAHGCDRVVLDAPATEGGVPFAEKHGGRVVGTEKRSVLDLRGIDRAQFEVWAAPSAANADYRSVRWQSRVPEDLVASYVRARNAMSDAPHGELALEDKEISVQEQRDGEASALDRGLISHVIAAVAPDGTVAGYTQVFTYPGAFRMAAIGDTAVVAAHRGHGLGLRLKAENTLRVLDTLPHIDVIDTWNNEDNAPMLRVNELLGYRFAELWQGFQFEV